ncbi:DUF4955 domain-containing protein [Polaribacter septentrionalilitoris]|uniref:DUF4955 domain-containing protein n=1 Tax=Polaribacter septentrionalilitoris TaxID=2494657 RepID=UPI00135738A7|nr:DUF4955 domain-containing protein [Polaribacter septentrionalilitoris]
MNNKNIFLCLTILFTGFIIHAQNTEAPSWVDFGQNKNNNTLANSILTDYSFSGYKFSEEEILDISGWTRFDVTDPAYGAVANDNIFDDDAVLAAVEAAENSNQPAIIFFPAGKYLLANEANKDKLIRIRKSNIVIKGAGSGAGGTEIFVKERSSLTNNGSTMYRFNFVPGGTSFPTDVTTVTSDIQRGSFQVDVANGSLINVGEVIQVYTKNKELLAANTPNLSYNPTWGSWDITNNGAEIVSFHVVEAINGNTITFKNPIQINLPVSNTNILIRRYNMIENVGVEDILFTSGWVDYPGTYVHNADQSLDTGWRAITMKRVQNSWIRNCVFSSWSECINFEFSIASTVNNIKFGGRGGHVTYESKYSYGILYQNCDASEDTSVHGPGMMRSTSNNVVRNCQMPNSINQSVDCHGTYPFSNLLENIDNGYFVGNGGAVGAYPNSGPDLTFWNFKHDRISSNNTNYRFWDLTTRRTNTYANPKFVGLQTPSNETVTFNGEQLDELRNVQVYPNSLFNAQLQLRLYGGYMSASSSKTGFEAKLANDKEEATFWESEGTGVGQWLMLDLGTNKAINEIIVKEQSSKIKDWKLEYWDATEWKELATGSEIGVERLIRFNVTTARKLRFNIQSMLAGQEASSASIKALEIGSGPLELVTDNFTIETIGETCLDKKNGSISITASINKNYVVSINGNTFNFTNTTTIENLSPGTYDFCITVEGDTFKQCYQATIESGASLLGKISIEKKKANINITEGTAPYTVIKNGQTVLETYQSNFSVDVSHGDDLQIKSKAACQGKLLKRINLLNDIKAYPNPSNGSFELYFPNNLDTIDLEVYNIQSQIIVSKTYVVKDGKVKLDIKDKPNGVYFVKVNSKKPVFVKVIKK